MVSGTGESETKILVPDRGNIVDNGIQTTYAGGPVRQSYAIVDHISLSGTKNLASDVWKLLLYNSTKRFLYICKELSN